MLKYPIAYFSMISSIGCNVAFAQDFTNIKDAKPLIFSSNLSYNQVYNNTFGTQNPRDPYVYTVTSSSNLNIYEVVNIPLFFTYTSQNLNYNQPFNFNQFGATPTYKWIKAHLGYSSMSFSPYSLSGHHFLGGGLELAPPGWFKCSAMFGRLRKSVDADTLFPLQMPSYTRLGYGTKLGFINKQFNFEFSVFKAWDDSSSQNLLPGRYPIAPMENLVFTTNANVNLTSKIKLTAELASSELTKDMKSPQSKQNVNILFRSLDFWQPAKSSSSSYNALKSTVTYSGMSYSIGLGYERIDPEYQTLGAYYFNNDLENITLNVSKSLMKGKVNTIVNVGKQRNNLDNKKLSNFQQWVSNVNISANPSNRLSLAFGFSNFSSFTNIKTTYDKLVRNNPYELVDTLSFTQINQNVSLSSNVLLGDIESKFSRQNLNLSCSFQKASQEQNSKIIPGGSSFFNTSLSYVYSFLPINLSLAPAANFNYINASQDNSIMGLAIAVTKGFFKRKLNSTYLVSYNQTYLGNEMSGKLMVNRLSFVFTPYKRHSLNLSLNLAHRSIVMPKTTVSDEFTGMLGYVFNF
jgi:hypothetical protein